MCLFLSLQLVEEYASRWQVPLPQLRILEIALCYFARASSFFTSNCDHVLRTLSSLALSVYELLLFFDQNDFYQEPLKHFTDTFQECYLALAKHQNVHLLQVERLVQGGGPWANPTVQAILSESSLPQNDVDGCISSELPVFFELRVRYLLSCERIAEAMALAKCCARHPSTGQHLFFLQVYLTWLYKTSQHDCLHKEVADLNGKNAVHIICNLEFEEKDELLLALSTAFLSQQLWRGDMYYLDLVFLWTKLHTRLNTSKQVLLEETRQLMLSATNVNSIFPFIRSILQEVGEDGIQFCVELCANALKSCLPCDTLTKSLIYKTIAGLLHNDLEVCRACALLIFFLERTVESYKMVYLLYMHPDQEYHAECSSIGNNVRFETLQVLKKDLYFDPEFWNLIALRTNCLKLMNEKGVSALTKTEASCTDHDSISDISSLTLEALEIDGTVQTQDGSLDTWENSDLMETPQESEESKLEYCCTFCKKDFKGTRVVAHAMFHYRKDECMFCGKVFTDDLLAMMHLSDHIEKLKRIKAQENGVPDTKDVSTPKTKAKMANTSSGSQSKGRPRKSTACPKSVSPPPESRKLRSNDKPADGPSSQEEHNTSKHLNTLSPVHKVNGHIDKKKEFNRPKKDVEAKQVLEQDADVGSSAADKELACSTEDKLKVKATKQIWKVVTEKNTEPQEKISCPADGCSFFTDISKNRVALLYHALDDHYGELKPLELAFRVGNNKCSICMRVLWSFEHFQHHVERHRWSPRHPCLHQGCTARFKSGMEMRRHARKHSPLQAVCCLPGCSHLFICLWALNLHEREHYTSKSTNSDKNTNAQTGNKRNDASAGRRQQSSPDTLTAAKKTESVKTALKLREQASQELSIRKQDKAAPLSISRSSLIKQKLKKKNESKNSNVLKSLSNKDTSAQPSDSKKPSAETAQATNTGPGYSVITNGQMSGDAEDTKSSVCKDTLAEYSKKPYMRLPPTAYLDEKYITMPKRRKDALSVPASQMSNDLEQACLTSAVQRQRCANCFATFNSVEELQSHRQLQKCSDLFGFDSDDEGE
uniref:C2H2-type domain-containing protein n=1 Tax=Oreochromis niloticus TaxID=8128 RepID=I3J0H6_ORENI